MERIPFNKPCFVGKELEYMRQAVDEGHISGNGPFSQKCEALLESALDAKKVLLTTSCTHALEAASLLLDVGPGDEVIVPSYTFVSTINAFCIYGAKPVFCDIRPDTLNLDEQKLESCLSDRTKVIVPVHYAGIACEMESILAAAAKVGAAVVEDNAHGLFAKQDGRPLGSRGAISTLSFHETKNFICGEGGALVLNDAKLVERAEIVREKGTNRAAFFRGQVDKYTWVDFGSSWLPSDLLAAFLFAQLEAKDEILATRRRIYETYARELADWAQANDVVLPVLPDGAESSYHMFHMRLPSEERLHAFIDHLKERGILAVTHYVPLHLSPMGQRFGARPGDCPTSEDTAQRLIRLPFYDSLSESDQARVCGAILEFAC